MKRLRYSFFCLVLFSSVAYGQQLSPRVGELSREAEACASQQDYSCCVAKYEVILKGYPGAKGQIEAPMKRCRNEVAFGRFKTQADGLFSSKKYGEALLSYQKALRYKTTNAYCLDRVQACQLELNFSKALAKADGLYGSKKYGEALLSYQQALRYKTKNAYCLDRVQACQLELNFSKALAKADGLYGLKKYGDAKLAYEEALIYKPENTHCKQQLANCVEFLTKPSNALPPANYVSRVGVVMLYVGGGRFTMGSNTSGAVDEQPEHEVELDGFYMGATEVTVGEYLVFCAATKTHWPEWLEAGNSYNIETGGNGYYKTKGYTRKSLTLPVVGVSYLDALAYCEWLSGQDGGREYSLPTEAQWEYAAGGGPSQGGLSQSSYSYAGSNDVKAVGWVDANSGGKPHAVKGLAANSLGLYDMSGNVWEWCRDWYAADWYKQSGSGMKNAENDGYGPKNFRVLRGGSWYYYPIHARVANRSNRDPQDRFSDVGFRVVASLSN
jgi:formylglycine-generating enzyme required for sulfatase activity